MSTHTAAHPDSKSPDHAELHGIGPARARAAARPLPLTVPPALSRPPALGRDVVYGLARVDRSGRVADRTVTGALGWCGGDWLTLTAEAGVVVIRRDSSGLIGVTRRCSALPGRV